MDKSKLKEILNKLVQDPELKKYPYSYNPVIIEKAEAQILALFAPMNEEKIEKIIIEHAYSHASNTYLYTMQDIRKLTKVLLKIGKEEVK